MFVTVFGFVAGRICMLDWDTASILPAYSKWVLFSRALGPCRSWPCCPKVQTWSRKGSRKHRNKSFTFNMFFFTFLNIFSHIFSVWSEIIILTRTPQACQHFPTARPRLLLLLYMLLHPGTSIPELPDILIKVYCFFFSDIACPQDEAWSILIRATQQWSVAAALLSFTCAQKV